MNFKKMLIKVITIITEPLIGVAAKGQPINYPIKGVLKVQSTCMPDDTINFNDWANNIKRAIG